MATLQQKFSNVMPGIIWNILADAEGNRLFIEVRNDHQKRVYFSALNLHTFEWLFENISFDEPWWISQVAIADNILLLTVYTDTNNPDKKSLVGYDVHQKKIRWWRNGFSFSSNTKIHVTGLDTQPVVKQIVLDIKTGEPVNEIEIQSEQEQNFPVIRPFQYEQGSVYFDTVKKFIERKLNISPVITIEYLEYQSYLITSVFVQEVGLANYLYLFSADGQLLLSIKLGEALKGIATDTFFILSGFLIFVKNKSELVSYQIL